MTTRDYHPRVTVLVNGLVVRTIAGNATLGLRSSFATAQFDLAFGENPALPNDRVQIILGTDETGTRTVFTGRVADDSLDYYPNKDGAICEGFLTRMQRGLGVQDAGADLDPTTGQRPAYQASGKGDAAISQDLLNLYGIPYADIQADSPAQTFGNIEPVVLRKDDPGWSLQTNLDFVTFCRMVDGLDGFARRVAISGLPGSASVTLTEGVSILTGSRRRSLRSITNHVTMTGLPDAGGPGVTPFGESFAASPVNPTTGEPYIPTPPQYQSEGQSSDLLETEAQCTRFAQRRVAAENRLSEDVTVQPERPRPDIYPGMTLAISSAHFRYSSDYVFFVEQITHTWGGEGITTTLGLLASSGEAGVNPNMAPVAVIHLKIERETLGDGSTIWVVFADGRDSYDPDGVAIDLDPQHGITTYLWSGTTAPVTPVGLSTATFVYTADPTGQTITLQVADVHLKLGSATVPVTAAMVAKVNTRVLWAAVTTDLLFSFDGGKVWSSVGVAAVGCCEIAHPTYQLAWTAAGALWRVTNDLAGNFAATLIAPPTAITAASVNVGLDGKGTGRAWAGGSDGKVWQSLDDGLTWANVGTITAPTGSATTDIRAISETPFPEHFGQLEALCGDAQFVSFDAGVTWIVKRAYADAALTATRQASGAYSDLSVLKSYHWISFAGTSSNTMSRSLEADLQEDVDFPVGDKPVQIRGLTIGILGPKLIAAGNTPTTRKIWKIADFTGGGNFVAATYNTAFGDPQHLIRDGEFDTIAYGAAVNNLFKTYDDFATILNLRTLSGGQSGKMIGYGPLHPPLPPKGTLLWSAWDNSTLASACIMALTDTGFVRVCDPHPCAGMGNTFAFPAYPLRSSGMVLFTWAREGNGGDSFYYHGAQAGNAFRSTDGGVTWTVLPFGYVNHIVPAGDGTTVYAASADGANAGGQTNRIQRSDDNGATWTDVAEWISESAQPSPISSLTASPANPLTITIHGRFNPGHGIPNFTVRQNVLVSHDGGVTWADTGITASDEAGNQYGGHYYSTRLGALLRQDARPATVPLRRSVLGGALDVAVTGAIGSVFHAYDDTREYYYSGSEGVNASPDDGVTWGQIYGGTNSMFHAGVHVGYSGVVAFLPGDANNDWYLAPGVFLKLGRRLSTAVDADLWDDLTTALDAAFPDGRTWPFEEGLARVES